MTSVTLLMSFSYAASDRDRTVPPRATLSDMTFVAPSPEHIQRKKDSGRNQVTSRNPPLPVDPSQNSRGSHDVHSSSAWLIMERISNGQSTCVEPGDADHCTVYRVSLSRDQRLQCLNYSCGSHHRVDRQVGHGCMATSAPHDSLEAGGCSHDGACLQDNANTITTLLQPQSNERLIWNLKRHPQAWHVDLIMSHLAQACTRPSTALHLRLQTQTCHG